MSTARELYAALNDAEKVGIKRQHLKATRPLASWRQTIERLAAFDVVGDSERATARTWLFGAIGLLVAAVVFGAAFGNTGASFKAAAGVLVVLGVLAVVVSFTRYQRLASIDVPDALRDFVGPLFTLLAEDLDPKKPVTLDIDLDRDRPSHCVGGERNMPITAAKKGSFFSAGITKIVEQHKRIPCFHLEGELVDGSHVVVDVKDFERVRTVHKKNPRGKRKRKTKAKTRRVIEAELTVAHKHYAVGQGASKLKQGEKRSTMRVKTAVLMKGPGDMNDPEPILRALAGLFARAQPVGKGA
jgi:hypothetical protein